MRILLVASRTIDQVRSEVARLDGIFSLHRDDSEISRLNRDGFLDNPSWELRDQLSAGRQFSELSGGADISWCSRSGSFIRPIFGPARTRQQTSTLPRGRPRNGWSITALSTLARAE